MKNAHQVKQKGGDREPAWKRIQNNGNKNCHNLEKKMELLIKSLETKTEKMQEMFNKDLEEIKKSVKNE